MLVMLGLFVVVVTVNARPKENFRIKLEEVERKAALALNPSIEENKRQIGSNGSGRGGAGGIDGTGRQIGSNGSGRGGTGGGIDGTGRKIGSNGTGRGGGGGIDGTGNKKA